MHKCVSQECIILYSKLMYAYDIVMIQIFSLRVLMSFIKCQSLCMFILTVNVEKTKIEIFRNGCKIKSNDKQNLIGHHLETEDKFVCLGVLLHFNVHCTQKQLACQAKQSKQSFQEQIKNSSKCSIYKHVIDHFCLQHYFL